jgi:uncharacterized protein (TIRG00374 family)
MKEFRRMLPGLLVSLVLIGAILYFVDLKAMFVALQSANFALVLVVFLLGLAWLFVRGWVWHTLLRRRFAYRDVFLTLMEGYLLNNFLPFRLGELGRAFLLSRKAPAAANPGQGMTFVEILPTIIIERVTDLAFSAAIFIAAVPFVVGASGAERIAWLVGGLVLVGLAALVLLARQRQAALDLFHKLSRRWPGLQRLGGSFLEAFLTGLEVLTDPWLSLRFFVLMTFNWGMAIVQYFLLIRAFFPAAQLVWGLFGLGAAAFGGAIPSLPGGVGTLEGAMVGALTLLSGNESTALAVALTSRLFNYIYSGTFGLYGLAREGQTVAGIYRQLMQFQSRSSVEDPDGSSRPDSSK